MSSEKEERITIDKPEDNSGKSKARVEAGKRLAEYNKAMRKRKELGETGEPVRHDENNNNDESVRDDKEMDGTTKILMLAGVAGLAYYLYTTTNNSKEEEKVKKNVQQPTVQNYNNDVQENTVSKLRSFKN